MIFEHKVDHISEVTNTMATSLEKALPRRGYKWRETSGQWENKSGELIINQNYSKSSNI